MTAKWYCKQSGKVTGPFSREDINYLRVRGRLAREDQLREGDSGPWTAASDVEGVFPVGSGESADTTAAVRSDAGTERREPAAAAATSPALVAGAAAAAGTRAAARNPAPPPVSGRPFTGPVPPPAEEDERDRRRRRILFGMWLGSALALLLLVLLLLLRPACSPEVVTPNDGISNEPGTGLGGGMGDGTAEDGTGGGGGTAEDSEATAGSGNSTATGAGNAGASESTDENQQAATGKDPADEGASAESEEKTEDVESATAGEAQAEPAEDEEDLFSISSLTDEDAPPPSTGGNSRLGNRSGGTRTTRSSAGMFSRRSPTNRLRTALREGGSRESEAAVDLGLNWLIKHQCDDGHWSLNAYHQVGDCNGQCRGQGHPSNIAGTALGLLPFLGAGETHQEGKYRRELRGAVDWLVAHQRPDGGLIDSGRMYEHGLAMIALSEAYAMTRDRDLREVAQKAVDFTVMAQNAQGAWRYAPRSGGDLSVTGWHVMGLQSARCANLEVPDEVFPKIEVYLNHMQGKPNGSVYGYVSPGCTTSMTSVGLLCRQYLGWHRDNLGMTQGAAYLLQNLPKKNEPHMYYWYYGTQVMHHYGGPEWKQWNAALRDMLIEAQHKEGHLAGSWPPVGGHAPSTGHVYMTALAICNLEVYYRHMPLYREPR